MDLPILAVLLASFVLTVNSHPKNSDVLPKDYYKRQILQPIPGYIPVYIKADGVPIVRTESKKHSPNVTPGKTTVPTDKILQTADVENLSKNQDKNSSDEVRSESPGATESKNPANLEGKSEPKKAEQERNEKPVENSHVKAVDLKS